MVLSVSLVELTAKDDPVADVLFVNQVLSILISVNPV